MPSREAASKSPAGDNAGQGGPNADGDASDAELLTRFAAGDAQAAQQLSARHLGRVLSLAARMLGDSAEAEDVAQETLLRAWRIAPKWDPEGAKFSTWLHRVALNLCYDRLRKRKNAPLDEAPEVEDETPSVSARMVADQEASALRAAIETLPERQRAAILLRHFDERSNPEIAAKLGVSVEAVESLLARGRRRLKAILGGAR